MTPASLGEPLAAASMPLAKSGEAAKSGPIGLAVILILCIGCYFLFKSMSKHLRIVREEFPDGADAAPPPSAPVVVLTSASDEAGSNAGTERPAKAVIVTADTAPADTVGDPGPPDQPQPGS